MVRAAEATFATASIQAAVESFQEQRPCGHRPAVVLFGFIVPGAPTWLRVVGHVIAGLAMAAALLLPASLLVVYVIACRASGHRALLDRDEIVISHGEKRRSVDSMPSNAPA